MKNLANYLEEYLEEDSLNEAIIKRLSKDELDRDRMKAARRGSREAEFEAHGKSINYNKVHRDRSKYTRKEKHKNRY